MESRNSADATLDTRRDPVDDIGMSEGDISRRSLLFAAPMLAASPFVAAPKPAPPKPNVIYWGNKKRKEVAITFDAAFDTGGLAKTLDILHTNGITASFALTGDFVRGHPDAATRILTEGHHLISHGMTHVSFTTGGPRKGPLPRAQRWAELDRSDAAFTDVLGVGVKPWFRPPYLSTNGSVEYDCALHGWDQIAMRSIDCLGWKRYPWQFVTYRCTHAAKNGTIFLFHVGRGSTDPDALQPIISDLAKRGFGMGSIPWVLRP